MVWYVMVWCGVVVVVAIILALDRTILWSLVWESKEMPASN